MHLLLLARHLRPCRVWRRASARKMMAWSRSLKIQSWHWRCLTLLSASRACLNMFFNASSIRSNCKAMYCTWLPWYTFGGSIGGAFDDPLWAIWTIASKSIKDPWNLALKGRYFRNNTERQNPLQFQRNIILKIKVVTGVMWFPKWNP